MGGTHCFSVRLRLLVSPAIAERPLAVSPVNLQGVSALEVVEGSTTDLSLVLGLLKERNVDTIVHMGAQSSVDMSFGSGSAGSLQFTHDNVLGTVSIAPNHACALLVLATVVLVLY